MLKVSAQAYIALGCSLEQAAQLLLQYESTASGSFLNLVDSDKEELKKTLLRALEECNALSLPVSCILLEKKAETLPSNASELTLLISAIYAELQTQLFLFIPQHRAPHFDASGLPDDLTTKFGKCNRELKLAGSLYALDQPTAAVFHAMRAAEICVRLLAKALKVKFAVPIELQEWQVILNAINGKLREIENKPKSKKRSTDLEFFGTAAAQLRFFKDGWRIKASHAGDLFSPSQARDALDHVRTLIEILGQRLSETGP